LLTDESQDSVCIKTKSVFVGLFQFAGGLVYFEEEQIVYYDLHWSRRTLLLKRTTPVKTWV